MTSRRKWGLTLLLQKMLPGCSVHCHLTRREKNKLRLDESHTNDCLTTIGRKEVFNKVFYAIFYLHILQLFIAMKLSTYTDVWLWSGNRETIYWTKFTANLENRLFLCISWHGHGGIMLYAYINFFQCCNELQSLLLTKVAPDWNSLLSPAMDNLLVTNVCLIAIFFFLFLLILVLVCKFCTDLVAKSANANCNADSMGT